MLRPTIIFEPHVPTSLQSYGLINDTELSFQKIFNHINNTDCRIRFAEEFIPPVIILSNEVMRSVKHYDPRDTNDFFPDDDNECKPERHPEGVYITTIQLKQYIPESHSIILYYAAIKEFADSHSVSYQDAFEYAMAAALFESLHQECFSYAYFFRKEINPDSGNCELLTCVLSEFYAFIYSYDLGLNDIQKLLIDTWKKYFYTTYPYAQALYFRIHNHRLIGMAESKRKHYKVFSITQGTDSHCIDNALIELKN